ncbi:MAG: hypothetical protein RL088_1691 [Verrucomicrobiota bacterium]|jgi:hypothetical protein
MKTLFFLSRLLTLIFLASPLSAANRDELWKQVDEAAEKGLPKTAIEKLGPIAASAIADKAWPEAIKALTRRITFESEIEGRKPGEKITRLAAELETAPKEMTPVLQAILANWYWQYFQQNRWRFMRRTQTAEGPGKDFTTWDLPRLFREIDAQFSKALAAEAELRKVPVAQYDAFLEKGTVPDAWRPTLFDFIAHQALEFYASGEQAGAKAQDEFELRTDGPVFQPTDDFLKWQPEGDSITVKAIKLHQALARAHAADADKSALLHCELERYHFANNRATGDEKETRYFEALKRFTNQWGDHELSAYARSIWAELLFDSDPAQAHEIAKQGAAAFPKTIFGTACKNIVRRIEEKSFTVNIERVWNDPPAPITVSYRNLDRIHFRITKADWEQRMKTGAGTPWLDDKERAALLAAKPEHAWSADLPATPDFRNRTEKIAPPKDFKPGFYFLLASHDKGFGEENNVVMISEFWVSDLSIITRTTPGEANFGGFVLDARTGAPVEGASVQLWALARSERFKPGVTVKTDTYGMFSAPANNDPGVFALVTHGGQSLATADMLQTWREKKRPDVNSQTIFFTDRSIYRPGQTIQYKGISFRADRDADNYKVLAGENVTVVFSDVNGKEIEKAQHKTNDYGSFSGSFTAPRDRLAGRMTIRSNAQPFGATTVQVEEYKRPKFKVALEPPKVPGKLDDRTSVEGKATAYTGAAIGGAKVRYRVVRQVRFPDWWGRCFWWRQMPRQEAQEIAHGTTVTKDDGGFTVEFIAKPDRSVSEKDGPTFSYTVYADVTDTTGETRSAQHAVSLGYTALKASASVDEWLPVEKPVELRLLTQTHDNNGQAAECVVKIHKLKQPEAVIRAPLSDPRFRPWIDAAKKPEPEPSNPDSWENGDIIAEPVVKTDGAGKGAVSVKLPAGPYRALIETKDRFGKKVTAQLPFNVINLDGKPLAVRIPNLVAAPDWSIEPGEEFTALWATGYPEAQAFIEIEHRGKMLQSYWTPKAGAQQIVKQKITEAMRGGFSLHVTMVRENRAYLQTRRIEVPWSNKQLSVKWEHFTSKMEPSQKETWTAVISGPDAKAAVGEMVATLYDQSLDAFLPHRWQQAFSVFRRDDSRISRQFQNRAAELNNLHGGWISAEEPVEIRFRTFPAWVSEAGFPVPEMAFGGMLRGGGGSPMKSEGRAMPPGSPMAMRGRGLEIAGLAADAAPAPKATPVTATAAAPAEAGEDGGAEPKTPPAVDLATVTARKNLNESAFFLPHLISRADGSVAMEFTMPEALTTWRFMGFAHDRELRAGFLEDKTVTSKDIMVQPNPPRFMREGDVLEFTVKVSNQSAARQIGKVRLTFSNARTSKSADEALGNSATDQAFDIPSHESRSFSWKLKIPDGAEPLAYKAVGSTDRLSDGEEGLLPVLSRRTLVIESLPLPIRGAQTKTFDFTRLIESGKSDSLQSQSLTVQMVSNPSWYAVMALPYLMEFPHECSEQTFNRLYANALARHIANADPKIRAVFDQWKSTPALDSPLEKNQDLKSVMLEETPWVREAEAESKARRNVGILFDQNRLENETARIMRKLTDQQRPDGAWPWFPGGPASDYITLYITTGFGRMRHLGVKIDSAPAVKSLAHLDRWLDRVYRDIPAKSRDDNHLDPTIALYLYGRSFFIEERPIAPAQREAVDYFLGQARKHWLRLGRQSQAHCALALKRLGDKTAAQAIMKSIQEHSVTNEEMGMFWRDTENSWSWQAAPIETQALMIEAFDEVMGDAKAVEDSKVWLLKQKQTQNWKTTKSTADAVYALLLRGTNVLASDALVEVSLGGTAVKPQKIEAGTGFFQERFVRGEVKPEQGRITLKKTDAGVSWGSVHWQYLEDMSKVTAYDGTPLKLSKQLFTRQLTKKGPVLEPVKGPVKVGDELVVRIVLKVDRDLEFVHLKDHRGSGTEPVAVLSQYKWQDGLGHYETTRDTAGHWFFDRLTKGNYVFETTTRIVHRGRYQTGLASIECMYAPEFGAHSESIWIEAQ